MHPNPAFRKGDTSSALDFAKQRGFGILSVNGSEGPMASHIPFYLSEDRTYIEAHLVRSNPIARVISEPTPALLAVSGPHGYISPDWYGVEDQVPTWNYIAVHIRGTVQLLPQDQLPAHLDRLSDSFEERLSPKPIWKMDKVSDEALNKLMRMIVPTRFEISQIDSTNKLAQNKPDEARIGAADGLETSTLGSELSTLAQLMREALD